ncbi:MAG: galactose mutarotase [Clostridia bacterium]|nr:galactose mutarotase [Clostridia bacterium]
MEKRLFGIHEDREIYIYTIKNEICSVDVINYGATLVRFVPFGTDIVGGFDTLEKYIEDKSCQGVTVGRVCNRIENAELNIDGAIYMLTENDGNRGNCLHGGVGFKCRVWNEEETTDSSVTFSYYSPDGEDGFPSALFTKVTYTLEGLDLIIDYFARPEGKTPIALTNHAFFNLHGDFSKIIFDHRAAIYADSYSKVNEKLIPTGEHPSVAGTAFDFNEPHVIGSRLDDTLKSYDHNYILTPKEHKTYSGKALGLGAKVDNGNLELSVYTDQPCVQFYTAGFLGSGKFGDAPAFKGGVTPVKYGAFCLEAQTEPNCCNKGLCIYNAGEIYTQTTIYSVRKI